MFVSQLANVIDYICFNDGIIRYTTYNPKYRQLSIQVTKKTFTRNSRPKSKATTKILGIVELRFQYGRMPRELFLRRPWTTLASIGIRKFSLAFFFPQNY